jgi:hypothetical protein
MVLQLRLEADFYLELLFLQEREQSPTLDLAMFRPPLVNCTARTCLDWRQKASKATQRTVHQHQPINLRL